MELRGHRTDDPDRLKVTAVPRKLREQDVAGRAFQQDRIVFLRQNACRSLTIPPGHERAA